MNDWLEPNQAPQPPRLTDMDGEQLAFLSSYTQDTLFVDTRPYEDFIACHIVHSVSMPGIVRLPSRLHELPHARNVAIGVIGMKLMDARAAASGLQGRYDHVVPFAWPLPVTLPLSTGPWMRIMFQPAPVLNSVPLGETALDIGCGCGRDAKYLSIRGVNVTAVDRDIALLSKLNKMKTLHYYADKIPSRVGRIETIERTFGGHLGEDELFLRQHASDLLLVVRFLRRGVFELLHNAVLPGGYVAYEHFLDGAEHLGGPRKQSQLLKMGELRSVFSEERGFVVLRDERCTLEDGRPVVRFVAHRLYT